jgi:hypothetical protein
VDNRSNGQEKKGARAGGAARRRAIPAAVARRSWPISVIWAPSCTRSGPGEGSRYRGSYRTSKMTDRGRVKALHGGGRHGVAGERRGAVLARVWAALHMVPHQRDTRKLPRAERPAERNYSSWRCTGKRQSGCCRKLGAPKISAKRSWGRGNAHRGWDWPEARRRAVVDDGGGGPTSPAAMSGQIRRRGSGSGGLEVCGGLGWPEGSCR